MTSALSALVAEEVGHLECNTFTEKLQAGDLQPSRRASVEELHAANASTSDGGNGYHRLKRAETIRASDALDHFLLPRAKTNSLSLLQHKKVSVAEKERVTLQRNVQKGINS